MEVEAILQELKQRLQQLYGERLKGLYLFGSHARGVTIRSICVWIKATTIPRSRQGGASAVTASTSAGAEKRKWLPTDRDPARATSLGSLPNSYPFTIVTFGKQLIYAIILVLPTA